MTPAAVPLTGIDRLLRIAIGGMLLFMAYWKDFQGIFLLFAGLGILVLFDRGARPLSGLAGDQAEVERAF